MSVWDGTNEEATITFYPLRRGVRITDTCLWVNGYRYEIDALSCIGWRWGTLRTRRRVVLQVLGVDAVLVAAVVAVARPLMVSLLCGALYLLVAGIVLAFSIHRWPTPRHLCATHDGVRTVLYTSTDHLEFDKVCRALMRATEQRELVE